MNEAALINNLKEINKTLQCLNRTLERIADGFDVNSINHNLGQLISRKETHNDQNKKDT